MFKSLKSMDSLSKRFSLIICFVLAVLPLLFSLSFHTDLLYYLEQLPEDILLVIEPADNVPYRHVIGVYNTCLKAKKKDIVFSISQ